METMETTNHTNGHEKAQESTWQRLNRLTEAEALAATGSAWRVTCYRDGNCRRVHQVVFVRSPTRQGAEDLARRLSGRKHVTAWAFRPWNDSTLNRFVRIEL